MKYIDPFGLETRALTFEGVDWGSSSFGHTATDINGTTYTYGPNGMTVLPTSEYLERNNFRDARALTLDLTPEQERKLEKRMKWLVDKGSYGPLGNNCTDPLENALEEQGYDLGINVTPSGLHDALNNQSLITGESYYPRGSSNEAPSWYQSAPWAGW
ncbi:hypothetical protein PARC_a3068 [Pseudoalteromonas arctica A 37-1-2]|uniref:DUF4105 domain-containing protein n=1 Tax=Pseudoalteromonas arctica A 37-1-2 TaxID=1117313 RepID=A0A290S6F2_9GAMM|nr:hypothetical protein PARC_a3068 [Pseudoalteromonas arctica A 37-1-2]